MWTIHREVTEFRLYKNYQEKKYLVHILNFESLILAHLEYLLNLRTRLLPFLSLSNIYIKFIELSALRTQRCEYRIDSINVFYKQCCRKMSSYLVFYKR